MPVLPAMLVAPDVAGKLVMPSRRQRPGRRSPPARASLLADLRPPRAFRKDRPRQQAPPPNTSAFFAPIPAIGRYISVAKSGRMRPNSTAFDSIEGKGAAGNSGESVAGLSVGVIKIYFRQRRPQIGSPAASVSPLPTSVSIDKTKSGARNRAHCLSTRDQRNHRSAVCARNHGPIARRQRPRNRRDGDVKRSYELELLMSELCQAGHRTNLGDRYALRRVRIEPLREDACLLAVVRRRSHNLRGMHWRGLSVNAESAKTRQSCGCQGQKCVVHDVLRVPPRAGGEGEQSDWRPSSPVGLPDVARCQVCD